MGIADLVPGVSGGTIALITGIYQRLINAIASINLNTLHRVLKGQISSAWKQIDGWFLLSVFLGMISAIFIFAGLIKYLLSNHSVLTWSFFFGLIVSSAVLLITQNLSNKMLNWFLLVIGVFVGYILSTQSISGMPSGSLGIFLAGMIAISAMILPGISGSLILILLGKYQSLLNAVENREWLTLFTFAVGCLIGLMVFSRLLKWLMAHFYQATIYGLAGLMLGTLFKVWPWKSVSGNILPFQHDHPKLTLAIFMMAIAVVFVVLLSRVKKNNKKA